MKHPLKNRVKMTVEMSVTVPQGLALQAMFEHWNRLSRMGSSRMVPFYVDGDGDFKPNCTIHLEGDVPELTPELTLLANCADPNEDPQFDYDAIAWKLREPTRKEYVDERMYLADALPGIAKSAGFQCIKSCCNVPSKTCNGDEWKGNAWSFASAVIKEYQAGRLKGVAMEVAQQPTEGPELIPRSKEEQDQLEKYEVVCDETNNPPIQDQEALRAYVDKLPSWYPGREPVKATYLNERLWPDLEKPYDEIPSPDQLRNDIKRLYYK